MIGRIRATPRSRAARAWLAGLIAVAVSGAAAAEAGAAIVGADLRRPATGQFGCEVLPTTNAFGGRLFLGAPFAGAPTCTYLGVGSLAGQAEVAQAPPGRSVVTRVFVKAGPVVGPMQVTVLKALRTTTPGRLGPSAIAACCFFDGASPPFTPAPNAVTAVNVRLPVRNEFIANFGEAVDYLGITVLAPGVPVPAQDLGQPGNVQLPGAMAFFPHVKPGDERADGAGVGAVVPLLAADVLRLCANSIVAKQAAGRCSPALAPLAAGRVAGGRATLSLACNTPAGCTAAVRILSSSGRRAVTLAAGRVRLAAGAAGPVQVTLTSAGRRLLASRRSVPAVLSARVGGRTSRARVVLRG